MRNKNKEDLRERKLKIGIWFLEGRERERERKVKKLKMGFEMIVSAAFLGLSLSSPFLYPSELSSIGHLVFLFGMFIKF